MCGIAGIITENALNYKNEINKMADVLCHRGPDDRRTLFFNNCALGHTRLSIIDIDLGQQPMKSPVSDSYVVFNGEIYGYKEIKKQFNAYPFKTKSDTEVLIALYDKYGNDMTAKLPGMFSFAIWNEKKQELFCARDRFGEKPFYYAFGAKGEFIFASEIKAIIRTGLIQPVLDYNALGHYLRFKYINPQKCIYKNIYVLPPANCLTYKKGELSLKKYWNFPEINQSISFKDAVEKFDFLLKNSVKKQLIADVPVSVFLSGGLDSSSLVILAKELNKDIKTFSFGFKNNKKNELPYAREIADYCKTEHIELTDEENDLSALLIEMQEFYDEPFSDTSNIPTYLLCKKARQYTKVALAGDGGDELLAGYTNIYRPVYEKLKNKSIKPQDIFHEHLLNMSVFSNDEIKDMWLTSFEIDDDIEKFYSGTMDDVLKSDLSSYLPGDILVKTDRASMANGLEIRAPFLDVDLAEFCISLPPNFKINDIKDKLIMRECFKNKWPEKIKKRNKQGFGAPLDKWLIKKELIDLKQEYIFNPSKKIYDILCYDKVMNYHKRGREQTWRFLVLSIWMETHSFKLP